MEVINVIVAAAAAYGFRAARYMTLAKPWMAGVGVTEEQVKSGSKAPYAISFVMLLVAAGMMRHIFALGGIDTLGKGLMSSDLATIEAQVREGDINPAPRSGRQERLENLVNRFV